MMDVGWDVIENEMTETRAATQTSAGSITGMKSHMVQGVRILFDKNVPKNQRIWILDVLEVNGGLGDERGSIRYYFNPVLKRVMMDLRWNGR